MTSSLFWIGVSCQPAAEAPSTARVTDVWGRPVAQASVVVQGHYERLHTDASGRVSLPQSDGVEPTVVRVGRKGFIPVQRALESDEPARFELLPEPSTAGLHAVGEGGLVELPAVPVVAVGTPLKSVRGTRSVGQVTIGERRPRFVFHTPLREDEILQLGLQLRRLSFVPSMEMPGPLGSAEVTVNLHVDAGAVPVSVTQLRERSDYLVVPGADLPAGTYAFQTQGLLSAPDNAVFDRLPPEFRMVFPFEVR